jgi:DNA-binding NarL/FixJ family response regulator
MTKSSILIVDDHPLVREGLTARIGRESDLEVCFEAGDVDEALKLLETETPDLMIVDISLKRGYGLNLIKQVRNSKPEIKTLVLSAHEETLFAERALRAGAGGYINKQQAQDNIIIAIRTVLSGERYLSDSLTNSLVDQAIDGKPRPKSIENLSDRELEIFGLIGRGHNTRAIAAQLNLSIHTIETHRENMRAKLNLRNGSELMQRAVQWVLESL